MYDINYISVNLQNTVVFCNILKCVLLFYALENIEELFFKKFLKIKIV